jgi:hypothetical protein
MDITPRSSLVLQAVLVLQQVLLRVRCWAMQWANLLLLKPPQRLGRLKQ